MSLLQQVWQRCRQRRILLVLSALSWGVSQASFAAIPLMDFSPLVEKVSDGVVNIQTSAVVRVSVPGWDHFFDQFLGGSPFTEQRRSGLGSGFCVEPEGYILTNAHVIRGADEIIVLPRVAERKPGERWLAKLVGIDDRTDMAVLRIGDTTRLKKLKFGDSDEMKIGQPVVAIGNPFGMSHTVTAGILSAKNRSIGQGPFDDYLQTDAAINPGNSGGPLFNAEGEVIGMNTAILASANGIGYAIPSSHVLKLLPQLIKHGRIIRPWLGFVGENITPQLARYLGLKSFEGVVIAHLVNRGPLHKVGARRADVIVKIDETTVTSMNDISKALEQHQVGSTVRILAVREGQTIQIKVKLAELPRAEKLPEGYTFL